VIGTVSLMIIPYGLSVANVVIVPVNKNAIDKDQVKDTQYSFLAYLISIYDFYVFIFWMIFLLGFRDLYLSYAISVWFFARKKDTVVIPRRLILKNLIRHHTGSVVFYAFVATFVTGPKITTKIVREALR